MSSVIVDLDQAGVEAVELDVFEVVLMYGLCW
jgi:hypothetical protein